MNQRELDNLLTELDDMSREERIEHIEAMGLGFDAVEQISIDMLDTPGVVDFDVRDIPDMLIVDVIG